MRPGSDRNRRLAEQLERKNTTGEFSFLILRFLPVDSDVRRKPLSHRIGDIGQGGARTLAAALQGTRSGYNQGGRVGKRLGPLAGRLQAPARNLNRQSQASSNE